MLQPVFFGCQSLDLVSHLQDLCVWSMIDSSEGQVDQTFVIAMLVVVIAERPILTFEVTGQPRTSAR